MKQTLRRREIVRDKAVIREVIAGGKKINGTVLSCVWHERTTSSGPASGITFGIILHRSIRRAVDRNLLKRRVREAFRTNKQLLGGDSTPLLPVQHIALIFRLQRSQTKEIPEFREIALDMKQILADIRQQREKHR